MPDALNDPYDGASLSDEQEELFLLLLQEEQLDMPQEQSLLPRATVEFPLSLMQRGLWFLNELYPDHSFYNEPTALRMRGVLDLTALEQSLAEVVKRHAALRTTFADGADEPMQIIASDLAVPLPVTDLSHLPEAMRESEAEQVTLAEIQRPFDLRQGPLVRALVVQFAPTDHRLVLTLHHIVCDGWSTELLLDELITRYQALMSRQPPALELTGTSLPIQYGDFALWQRQLLAGDELDRQLAYWREQLAGAPPVLELPTDYPRPLRQSYQGATLSLQIPVEIAAQLKALSQQARITPFMCLVAAFQTLLLRYSGQTDMVIGTPIANRPRGEFERIIGLFANTLVLRTDLSGNPSFRELLARVRATCLQAYDHQDVPFERVVEVLQPERSLSYHPVFQVVFSLQNTPPAQLKVTGIDLMRELPAARTTRFDLSFEVTDTEAGLHTYVEYNSDLFAAETMTRMLGHWQSLLGSIVADPDRRLSDLQLLTAAETRQLLVDWNATHTDVLDPCIHQAFEAQVLRTPDAPAVIYADEQLTYQALNERANRLAHWLRGQGVGLETYVGLCAVRSFDLIVGMLGILKAGGVYVPLDPATPSERLAYLLRDAEIDLIVTPQPLPDQWTVHQQCSFCLEQDAQELAALPTHNPANVVHASNLAYVIYTSGSTGTPKGVLVTHQSVCSCVRSEAARLGVDADSRILQYAPFTFDVSVLEVLLALLHGGTLVMAPSALLVDSQALAQLLDAHSITTLTMTPSALGLLPPTAGRALRSISIGGEVCPPALAQHWASRVALYTCWGATEATIDSTLGQVTAEQATATLPAGRPLANTQIYVLDAQLQPVPIGVPGEAYIAGIGLARGYLKRPDLTAERFIPNPFSHEASGPENTQTRPQPGALMYRTGDLVTYLPDGTIKFVRRIDQQIKLRGFRIELGEIEAVLREHPVVRDVVAVLREDTLTDKRIIAYIVPHSAQPDLPRSLQAYLKDRLPVYMIPSAFVTLHAIPLTTNGKLDYAALPAPELSALSTQGGDIMLHSSISAMVAELWADLLQVAHVAPEDNFFDLGGHSLLATRLVARMQDIFKVDLSLRVLFETSTLMELVEHLIAQLGAVDAQAAPPILPAAREHALPLSFAQQRLWFLDQLEPNSAAYNLAHAFRLHGRLDVAALEQSLRALVERHEALRTTFITTHGRPRQAIHAEIDVPLVEVDLRALPAPEREAEAARHALIEAQRPFVLAEGPLLRTVLVRLGESDAILLLTLHHIICDGWSIDVLIEELSILYTAFVTGQPAPRAALPIQYADFALWQRQWLQGAIVDAQIAYWREQLANIPAVLDLPTDYPRPPVQTYRGRCRFRLLPAELTDPLVAVSRQEGATLFMTLLAAFQTLLLRYTGQTDVVVGSPIANRTRTELEGLIGFFANTLVLRADLSGNPSFRLLITQVRDTCLGAYTHQDLPFEQLVEVLQPERNLRYAPLFTVQFILHTNSLVTVELPDLRLTPVALDSGTSKFDLTLGVEHTASGLQTYLEYNTDLFAAETIERLLEHWQTLLTGIVANPNQRLYDLPLLTPAEARQLCPPARAVDLPVACIHDLFAAQAARRSEAIAVVLEQQQLTYGTLNLRANQLAHVLQARGVGPEVRVGICLEASLDLIVAVLAVLKAGGAYVPLDPTYPAERLAWIVADAGVQIVLTHQRLQATLPMPPDRCLYLDADWTASAPAQTDAPLSSVCPAHAAYVIYTSGSTGTPKGVVVTHANVVRLFEATLPWFGFNHQDVWTLFHSYAFDFSVWELWGALLYGGRLVLVNHWVSRSPEHFYSLLQQEGVTVLNQTPSAFRQLMPVDAQAASTRLALRLVIFGGEALDLSSLRPWIERHGDQSPQLINMYGITETTVHVTYRPITRADLNSAVGSAIGQPIPDLQTYVLDAQMRPLPSVVPGEIYVGGAGVARGYLNQPALTAERFVPDPFSATPGARLYRSGDLGRYRPDNSLEYLGRADQQVKLRGFRIELGEIEQVLGQHPAVQTALVIISRGDAGAAPESNQLVAYIVPHAQTTMPTTSELRRFLQQQLPAYMVPAAFVTLDALPLTHNGKIDRRALPAPLPARPSVDSTYIEPETTTEQTLAMIWARVLGVARVGIHDNFFELGGDSILSIQVVAQAKQHGLYLTPKQMFEHQTIAQMAQVAQQSTLIQAQQGPVVGPVPLTPIQQWFFEQELHNVHHWNQSALVQVRRPLDMFCLEQAINILMQQHDALRLCFTPTETGWQQAHTPAPDQNACVHYDLARLPAQEQCRALETTVAELQQSLNITSGRLIRVAYFTFGGAQADRLLIVIHHLAVDEVSWRMLLEDLETIYTQLEHSQPPQLPLKTTAFQDWARAVCDYTHTATAQKEYQYWLAAARQQAAPIPRDRAEGENTVASAHDHVVSLSVEETRSLLHDVPKVYRTQINDVLLTALAQAIFAWTGQPHVRVDLEGHGREEIVGNVDLSRTVGWFTAIFPVVLSLPTGGRPGSALQQIKEQLRAVPHKGIGYGVLRYLAPASEQQTQLKAATAAEICFNYLGQLDQSYAESALWSPAPESGGPLHSPANHRRYLLEVTSYVQSGCLQIAWTYSAHVHRQSTIERVAEQFVQALRDMITDCQAPHAGGYTPSDFPKAQLSQRDLDKLQARLGKRERNE